MKRFISMLLAALMTVSVLGGMSFAGAEDVAAERAYFFEKPENDKLTSEIWNKDETAQNTILPLIGYGDHGFKYWIADDATEAAARANLRALQFWQKDGNKSGYFRMYTKYNGNPLCQTGIKVSVALEKPSTVPSFYKVTVAPASAKTTKTHAYTSILDEDKRTAEHVFSKVAKNGGSYNFNSNASKTLDELIWNNGADDHVIGFHVENIEGDECQLQLGTITLTPVKVTSVAVTTSEVNLLKGETKEIRMFANLSDESQMFITDSYITYESSAPDIASVAADGTITANKAGTAKITATVGEFSKEVTVNVGKHVYETVQPAKRTADIWDSAVAAGKNMSGSIVPLIGFGSHGFKYWDADDASVGYQATNVRALQFYSGGIRAWSYGEDSEAETFSNDNGAKLALVFKTPRKGFYTVSHTKGASDGGCQDLRVYMEPITAAEEAVEARPQVESYLKSENLAKKGYEGSTGTITCGKIIALDGVDNFIWAVSVDPKSRFSIKALTLTELEVAEIALKAAKSELEIDETTMLSATADGKEIVPSFVKFNTNDTDVIGIAADGTVTAKAAGEATITATANGLSAETKITVAEPVVEPTEPGEELSGTVTFGFGAEQSFLNDYVSADGYTAGSPAQVPVGTKITLSAEKEKGAYRFSHWKISGRFYSAEENITITVARNTSVVARYEDVEYLETENYRRVYFWNADKSYYSQINTPEEKLPYIPGGLEMTGMRFVGWYLDEETKLTEDTVLTDIVVNAVAKYEPLDTEYTVKVNGEENEGKYNSPVSVSAPEAFTYWKLGEEKLSFRRAFEFFNYGNAEITSVFDASVTAIPTVVIEKNLGAAFIAYDTPAGYERIEAGIIFGSSAGITVNSANSKANAQNTAAFGQFTAKPYENEQYARGYQIFKKDGKVRVIYTEAIEIN